MLFCGVESKTADQRRALQDRELVVALSVYEKLGSACSRRTSRVPGGCRVAVAVGQDQAAKRLLKIGREEEVTARMLSVA